MERSFSATLSELRRRRGLSQRAAAADLRVSQALMSHYENGAREPGLGFVARACDYYGVTADYLLGRSDSETGGEGGLEGDAASALAVMSAALRALESPSVSQAAYRRVTALFLKLAARAAEGGREAAGLMALEEAAAELDFARALRRADGGGGPGRLVLGAAAKGLISEIEAKLFDR